MKWIGRLLAGAILVMGLTVMPGCQQNKQAQPTKGTENPQPEGHEEAAKQVSEQSTTPPPGQQPDQ